MSQGTEFRYRQALVLYGKTQGCWGCSSWFTPEELKLGTVKVVEYEHSEIMDEQGEREFRKEVIRKRKKSLCEACLYIYTKGEWYDKKWNSQTLGLVEPPTLHT